MKYEDDLRKSLTKLFKIKRDLKPLEEEEEKLKTQIKKWMDLNDIDKLSVKDDNSHVWILQKTQSKRKNIKDWEMLLKLLQDSEKAMIVAESVVETYKITSPELGIKTP